MWNLQTWIGGAAGLIILALFGLVQMKDAALQKAREDKGRFEALYEAEARTATAWKDFAETQTSEAIEAARREGAAVQAETERQRQLSGAYRTIGRLERDAQTRIEPACAATVLRDADTNRLYIDTLAALANRAAIGAESGPVLQGTASGVAGDASRAGITG